MDARFEERNGYRFRMVEIYNFNTGKREAADYFLSQGEEVIIKLRYSMKKKVVSYGCPLCKTAVSIVRSKNGNFFYRHMQREEGVECAIVDDNMPEHRKEMQRYNAAKESEEHKRLKRLIHKYLQNDPKVLGTPQMEKIQKGTVVPTTRKRPDVSCNYNNRDFVFEVQISNTWLSDIVARDSFYEIEKTTILWVFNSFDPFAPSNDLTKADIFYNNPEVNLFVLDEDAIKETKESNTLTFKCYYRIPTANLDTQQVDISWTSQLVTLEDLIIDTKTFKPYVFPYYEKLEEAKLALDNQLKEQLEKDRLQRNALLEKERLEKIEQERITKKLQKEQEELWERERLKEEERKRKIKEYWAAEEEQRRKEKEEQQRLEKLAREKRKEKQRQIEANKIENRCPKEFFEMKAKDCVDLLFQNRLSRNLPKLNIRISELRDLGFNLPYNVLDIMEDRNWIYKMNSNLSLTHYERSDNLRQLSKSA